MEIFAIQLVLDGWETKSFIMVAAGIALFLFDTVTDLMGFPT